MDNTLRGGNYRHGYSFTRTHNIWCAMKKRCKNSNDKKYPRYGGRGIRIDPKWEIFENFLKDMGPCPDGMSIDRIDNDGNYCKKNCRWADQKTQQNNRSNTKKWFYKGKKRSAREISEMTGIKYGTLRSRLYLYGFTVAQAIHSPVQLGGDVSKRKRRSE